MDNQHRKITGYRELNQEEIDLMNKVKALGPQIEGVLLEIQQHLMALRNQANNSVFDHELGRKVADGGGEDTLTPRLENATPERFLALAKTDLQTGLMYATRAVAQPEFF